MKIQKLVFLFLTILVYNKSYAQSDTIQEPIEKGIWLEPITPSFPQGEEKRKSFIKLVQQYPDSAKARGIEGKVYVQFVVNKTGKLSDFKILRAPDTSLSKEAIRIMKLMPNWIPGTNYNGDSVDVKMVMPIEFRIVHNKVPKVNACFPQQANFPGGQEKLFEYLAKNIKNSDSYFKDGVKSKFYFEFIVEKDGSLSNLKMLRNYNEEFYKHVLQVFNNMPKWKPASVNGQTVSTKMIIPMNICISR